MLRGFLRQAKIVSVNFLQSRMMSWSQDKISLECQPTCGDKRRVNGVEIYYETVGSGEHAVLMMPGILGSTSDFQLQMEYFDQDRFTLVTWDPRGYGRSRPPLRDFPLNFYHRDADDAARLMQSLGFSKYSLLGWSQGSTTAAILAANYNTRVRKLVLWGACSYFTHEDVAKAKSLGDLSKWKPEVLAPLMEMYGKDYFIKTWNDQIDTYERMTQNADEKGNTDLYTKDTPKIRAKTLILHGTRDPLISPSYAPKLQKNIKDSRLVMFEKGNHYIHVQQAKKFNKVVEDFLLESDLQSS